MLWTRRWHFTISWFVNPHNPDRALRAPSREAGDVALAVSGATLAEAKSAHARLRHERSHAIVALESRHPELRRPSMMRLKSWELRVHIAGRRPDWAAELFAGVDSKYLALVARRSRRLAVRTQAAIATGNEDLIEAVLLAGADSTASVRRATLAEADRDRLLAALSIERLVDLACGRSRVGERVPDGVSLVAVQRLPSEDGLLAVIDSAAPIPVREAAVERLSDLDMLNRLSSSEAVGPAARRRLAALTEAARDSARKELERKLVTGAGAEFLGSPGDPGYVERLRPFLESSDAYVRAPAIRELAKAAGAHVEAMLISASEAAAWPVQSAAAIGLLERGSTTRRARKAIAKVISTQRGDVLDWLFKHHGSGQFAKNARGQALHVASAHVSRDLLLTVIEALGTVSSRSAIDALQARVRATPQAAWESDADAYLAATSLRQLSGLGTFDAPQLQAVLTQVCEAYERKNYSHVDTAYVTMDSEPTGSWPIRIVGL